MSDYTFILTRSPGLLDTNFKRANTQHIEWPIFMVRVQTPHVWATAVRKAKEACLAYEKAEVAAGRLQFTDYYANNLRYHYYKHFAGATGHPSIIRLSV